MEYLKILFIFCGVEFLSLVVLVLWLLWQVNECHKLIKNYSVLVDSQQYLINMQINADKNFILEKVDLLKKSPK